MKIMICDYKECGNHKVFTEVRTIEENYHGGVTIVFECGEYLCVPNNQYTVIKIY